MKADNDKNSKHPQIKTVKKHRKNEDILDVGAETQTILQPNPAHLRNLLVIYFLPC
jgi:hypothetical protein